MRTGSGLVVFQWVVQEVPREVARLPALLCLLRAIGFGERPQERRSVPARMEWRALSGERDLLELVG